VCILFALTALWVPDLGLRAARWLAVATHLKDPAAGAAFLARVAPPLAIRASALLLAGAMLVALASRQRVAIPLLFVAVCADLLITNGNLNVTTDVAKISPPAWFTAAAGAQRLYIGGRVRGYMNANDPDAVSTWQIPAESTAVEGRMELNALLPMAPSGWRVREALSYDLPHLWPAEYEATVRRFEQARIDERDAFLRRSGVRWCVLPRLRHGYAGQESWRIVAEVDDWNMHVYDCHPDATRVFIAESVEIGHDGVHDDWERDALFDPALPDTAVRLSENAVETGRPGPPEQPSVRIVDDGGTTVTVEAALARPGVLVLRDTYDPSWAARVDGVAATIVRANGLYRAVALPSGRHVIRFTYRPGDFLIGLMITVATGLVLAFTKL
jgi:hypothetical protein